MKSQEMRIMYAGYADRVEGRDNSWKVIPDSEDARKKRWKMDIPLSVRHRSVTSQQMEDQSQSAMALSFWT